MITQAIIAISIGNNDGSMVLFFNSLSYVKYFFDKREKDALSPWDQIRLENMKLKRYNAVLWPLLCPSIIYLCFSFFRKVAYIIPYKSVFVKRFLDLFYKFKEKAAIILINHRFFVILSLSGAKSQGFCVCLCKRFRALHRIPSCMRGFG